MHAAKRTKLRDHEIHANIIALTSTAGKTSNLTMLMAAFTALQNQRDHLVTEVTWVPCAFALCKSSIAGAA